MHCMEMEMNLLTQKTVDDIVNGSTELVRNTVGTLKVEVFNCLQDSGIKLQDVPGINDIFSEDSLLQILLLSSQLDTTKLLTSESTSI